MSNYKDSKSCALYIANGVIVGLFDAGHVPTIADVRDNFNMKLHVPSCNDLVTDGEINDIISAVAKYYNL